MKIRYAIVDDAAFIRELIRSVLNSAGATCVGEAEDGAAGVDMVSATLPDVVFLDLSMPKKNGIEAAKEMKEVWPDVKIIVCSTIDQEAMLNKALAVGVSAYLTKPFTKDQIIESVEKLISGEKEMKV